MMSNADNIAQGLRDRLTRYAASTGSAGEICTATLETSLEMAGSDGELLSNIEQMIAVFMRLNPDPATLSTALLYLPLRETDAKRPPDLPEIINRQLDELHKLDEFRSLQEIGHRQRNAEGLRRLLLALVDDVRVVLIALSWQLVRLQAASGSSPEVQKALADETFLIHAPLANRLGVWQLKWELEDLAFRFQKREEYNRIAALVSEKRLDREEFISGFRDSLTDVLKKAGIQADIKGRPKHIYSIWRKMQRKGLDYHELFDVRAVRVLVDSVAECYSVLGLVHTHWQPVPGEFDDYITTPKGNLYQSLHTAVVVKGGKSVEVQIRTWAMHEHAELGVAAHWRYKEGGPVDPGFDRKVTAMRQILDTTDGGLADENLLDSFESVTSEDRVYALTPTGDVVDLNAGSTVLDFAYHIHTEVGHRCRGAKINGRIVQLTQLVSSGDRVEILTGKHPKPSRDWLNPRLGYIHGARARSKVRQWFRQEHYDENLQAGRDLLSAELERLGVDDKVMPDLLARYNMHKPEELYVAIGNGDLTVAQVVRALERQIRPVEIPLLGDKARRKAPRRKPDPDDIVIEGVGNLLTTMARCCQPVPGDPISGYITRGRGVSIHRGDCPHLLNLRTQQPSRVIEVDWGTPQSDYPVRLMIEAYDRTALIKDISTVLAAENVSVSEMNTQMDAETEQMRFNLMVRIRDLGQLSDLASRLSAIPNVQTVRRTD